MIHVQHGEKQRLDMTRFNDAFMMHTSTSPQYGIIASCDVAAAMMEQPAGRALVQETIDEALSFRRAMTAVKQAARTAPGGSTSGSPTPMAAQPADDRARWVLKPGDRWHGFEDLAENHVLVDPIKVTILTPGLSADGSMQQHGIPAAVVTKFLSSRRIEIEKTGLYSFLVLFSMGITKGKWSTLVTELHQLQGPVRRQRAAQARAAGVRRRRIRRPTRRWASRTCASRCTECYREDNLPKAQKEMYTTLPEMAMRPADAYERLVRGRVESVEIDQLMGRTLAVMMVPYPPGIPLIMPGERITAATKSIHDYLLYARDFDRQVPGLRDRYPRPALRARLPSGQALSGRLRRREGGDR